MVTAWLERDVHRGSRGSCAGILQSHDFGVRSAKPRVPSLAHNVWPIVVGGGSYDNTTHHGIRLDVPLSALGELNGLPHEVFVDASMH